MESVRAIILAAGFGSRLGALASRCAKCVVDVGGRPILAHSLDALVAAGIRKVTLVVGHLGAQVRACASAWSERLDLRYITNERVASTGTAYSLGLGLATVAPGETVLVIEADVVFGHEALAHLLQSLRPNGTLVAPLEAHVSGSAVLCDNRGVVREWLHATQQGRDFRRARAFKTVNLTRVNGRTAATLLDLCASTGPGAPLEYAMRSLVRSRAAQIYTVGVQSAPWCEVDTPEDLRHAELLFGAGLTGGHG